ncbi:class I SAM-dependent methyltransferase family protein [archaeon]|nr:class I SAM-dependent methyltransferase family protein [archaeon]
MVLAVKVPLKDAQEVKRFLIDNALFNPDYGFKKDNSSIFFPISKKGSIKKRFLIVEFVDVELDKLVKKKNLRATLEQKLSPGELAVLRRAFDTVGTIAIIEIPPEAEKNEKLIAETLLKLQKNVKTVLKKGGIHDTDFRTQQMVHLAGVKTKETIHKEHGVMLKLDVEKVYFSPRLSTERLRVASQVKPGESILVMFSGCAPYPCVIAKNAKPIEIVGVELNPIGHKYGLENLKLNKIGNVTLINGDVKDIVPKLNKKFDRIVMPLPKSAGDFLDSAFSAAKKGTIIHFYAFEEEGRFDVAERRILDACKKNNLKCKILKTVKCGQHAPRTFRICVDFKII